MNTLNELDLFCTEEHFDASMRKEVLSKLRDMGLSNLATLLEGYAENHEHIDTVVEHFGCTDLEEVATLCDNFEVDRTIDYIHCDSISDYIAEEIDPKVSEFASSMDSAFDDFMEDTNYVRHREKLGVYVITQEGIDQLPDMLHQKLSDAGLE